MDKLNRFGLYADPMRSTQADFRDILSQKHCPGLGTVLGPPPERRSTISGMQGGYSACTSNNSNCNRMRNLSGGSVGSTTSGSSSGSSSNLLDNQYSSNSFSHLPFDPAPFANSQRTAAAVNNNNNSSFVSSRVLPSQSSSSGTSHHRNSRQERSSSFYNDTHNGSNGTTSDRQGSPSSSSSLSQQQSQRSVNSSRYKTELCRPFEESGSCKYGDKCQFAHGVHELRNLSRHPKYKTELCRTFHTIGYCPYGPRCHFIHGEEPGSGKSAPPETLPSPNLGRCGSDQSSSGSSSPSLSPSGCSDSVSNFSNVFCYQSEQGQDDRQQNTLISGNVNNSRSTSSTSNVVDRFSMMNLNSNEERDIFSHVTTFSEDELLDNASIPPAIASNLFPEGRQQLDNFPSFSESSSYDVVSCILGTLSGHNSNHHSLTGSSTGGSSSGSDSGSSGGSDCGGSTENLNSTVFSDWRSTVAIGQY